MSSESVAEIVDIRTGELIHPGDVTLSVLAAQGRTLIERTERNAWELGKVAAMARAICEDRERAKAEGYDGPNPDARFGAWVCENFSDTHKRTMLNARQLWKVFGERQAEVASLPLSGLYLLAAPSLPEPEREALVSEYLGRERAKVADIKADVRQVITRQKQIRNAESIGTGMPDDGTCEIADLHRAIEQGFRFGCLYVDPPWIYDNQSTRASTGNHYDGMTVDQLCEMPVRKLAAEHSHLHLWTTNAFLFECPRIMAAWGFEFRSTFIWIKPQLGIGNYWRNSHEILLTGIRGDTKRFNDKSLKSWIQADRTAHSEKPERIRGFIERASHGPYIELFGRRLVQGWAVWGNQIRRTMFDAAIREVA